MQTRTLGQLAQFDFLLYFCSAIDNYPDYLGCFLFVRIHEWIDATRKLAKHESTKIIHWRVLSAVRRHGEDPAALRKNWVAQGGTNGPIHRLSVLFCGAVAEDACYSSAQRIGFLT